MCGSTGDPDGHGQNRETGQHTPTHTGSLEAARVIAGLDPQSSFSAVWWLGWRGLTASCLAIGAVLSDEARWARRRGAPTLWIGASSATRLDSRGNGFCFLSHARVSPSCIVSRALPCSDRQRILVLSCPASACLRPPGTRRIRSSRRIHAPVCARLSVKPSSPATHTDRRL